jgi:hypothetical protein
LSVRLVAELQGALLQETTVLQKVIEEFTAALNSDHRHCVLQKDLSKGKVFCCLLLNYKPPIILCDLNTLIPNSARLFFKSVLGDLPTS